VTLIERLLKLAQKCGWSTKKYINPTNGVRPDIHTKKSDIDPRGEKEKLSDRDYLLAVAYTLYPEDTEEMSQNILSGRLAKEISCRLIEIAKKLPEDDGDDGVEEVNPWPTS